MNPLVVGSPTSLLRPDGGSPPAPAWTATSEVTQPRSQCQLVVGGDGGLEPLRGVGLAHDPARPAFAHPELLVEGPNGPPTAVTGSDVSPVKLPQHVDAERLVGDDLLEPRVLLLEFLQPPGVIRLRAPVLVAPAVPRRLGDLEVASHLLDRSSLAEKLLAASVVGMIRSGVCRRRLMVCCPHSPLCGARTRIRGRPAYGVPVKLRIYEERITIDFT